MKQLKLEGVPDVFRDLDGLQAQTATVARVVGMTPADQELAEALFAAAEWRSSRITRTNRLLAGFSFDRQTQDSWRAVCVMPVSWAPRVSHRFVICPGRPESMT
jgi:hypothetical protein